MTTTNWIDVKEKLPICYESGSWDGLRSDPVLCVHKNGTYKVCRLYSGILDGHKFNDFCEMDGFMIDDIIFWQPIQPLDYANEQQSVYGC